MKHDRLSRFLRAVRARLWLENALSKIQIAVLVGSTALLALAAFSAFILPIPLAWVIGSPLAVTVLVALPFLLRVPTLANCAVRADQQFQKHSLLTTAHEALLGKIDDSPSTKLVISQANSDVIRLSPKLSSVWQAPSPAGFALAAIPAFLALILLMVATPQDAMTSDLEALTNAPTSNAEGSDNVFSDHDVAELRESILQNSNDDAFQAQGSPNSQGVAQIAAISSDTNSDSEPTEISNALPTQQETPMPGGGADAGDASRSPGTLASIETKTADVTARVEQQINRRGDIVAGGQGSDDTYTDAALVGEIESELRVAAAAAPSDSPWTSMSAAEVAYARRYLSDWNDDAVQ